MTMPMAGPKSNLSPENGRQTRHQGNGIERETLVQDSELGSPVEEIHEASQRWRRAA
jgi:hypothetical protein